MPLPRIAIVGAPNVGKSTLFNRLVGSRRSLVADVPGLTRDCIEGVFNLTQRPVLLVDTGGLMSPGDAPLAAAIREKVLDAARRSDLLLFVVDGRRGLTPFDRDLSRLFRESGKTTLLVVNKVDGNDRGAYALEFAPLGYDHDSLLSVSAEHGLGISELCEAIGSRLPPPAQDVEHEPAETRIAIAGRPNVGKSSLLNALLKEDRSLVSEEPGTTRDPVDSLLVRGSKRYRFIDTAGLRRAGHVSKKAEILSVGAARRSIRSADVTLVLLDAVEGVVAQDLHVLGLVAGGEEGWVRPAVVLLNKIDLLESRDRIAEKVEAIRERIKFARFAPIVPVSALRRLHLDRVFAAIDAVSEEAARLLKTSELNDWLRDATRRHAPPRQARRPVSLVFASQAGVRPVTIIILTNRDVRLHFSYRRHLENSLRDRFALHHTPIVLRFRARIRDRRPRRGGGSSSGREPPKAPPRAPRGAPRGAPRRAPARGSRGGGSRDRTDPTSEDSAN